MDLGISLLLISEFSSLEDAPPHKSGVWEDEGQWWGRFSLRASCSGSVAGVS